MHTHPNKKLWTGRIDSETDVNSLRFHQVIQFQNNINPKEKESAFHLVGFESDEGVKRNKGRVGAAKAPDGIRSYLASLPSSILRGKPLIDTGNITCEGDQLEKAQADLGAHVSTILTQGATPIILGGGHETLYGHYLGARKHLGKDASLGIINIDAHFDMREEEIPSSGTMFRQILEADKNAGYLCLGIQPFGNTNALFKEADRLGCTYLYEQEVTANKNNQVQKAIDDFAEKYDAIILTLCTDSIIASEAPGVSAPAPFGLNSKVVQGLLQYIVAKKKTLSFDISEVNPLLDENDRTQRLAAYLIAEVLAHFHRNEEESR